MSKVIYRMMMSLDGLINDREGKTDPLYEDFDSFGKSKIMKDYIATVGAVVMGRITYEMAEDPDWYADNYEHQTPLYVVTRRPPEKHPRENDRLKFNFMVDGVESAVTQAKKSAGDKVVSIVGGANIAKQAMELALVDELHIDVMPVLLCKGLRLFGDLDLAALELERTHVGEVANGRTQLVYRVQKAKRSECD